MGLFSPLSYQAMRIDLHPEGDINDRTRMLNAAFTAITAIMSTLKSAQREDIRGVAILLYTGTPLAGIRS